MTNGKYLKYFIASVVMAACTSSALASHRSLNQWFDEVFGDVNKQFDRAFIQDGGGIFTDNDDQRPRITVTSKEDHMVVAIDLKVAHINKKDCTIEATEDNLTVALEHDALKAHFAIKNYRDGALMAFDLVQKIEKEPKSFVDRSYAATKTVAHVFDFTKTDASFKDGMLTLLIPYKKEHKKVSISLK